MRIMPSFATAAVLSIVAVVLLGLVGCGGSSRLGVGRCAEIDGDDDVTPASCDSSSAEYVVLARLPFGATDRRCEHVAAVTYMVDDQNARERVCFGTKGADPARALNVAQLGDCTTATVAAVFEWTDCAASDAVLRVLARAEDAKTPSDACMSVVGTTKHYTWSLARDLDREIGLDYKIVLCLGPKDLDPAMSADVATAGDCLTGIDENASRVDCAAPSAANRVLGRIERPTVAPELACEATEGALWAKPGAYGAREGYVLCLGAV